MMVYGQMAWGWFRGEILAVPGRVIATVFVIFLVCFPAVSTEPFYLRIITLATIFALFAVSWDVLAGFCGQLSLGHALFFGVAAYVAGGLDKAFDFSPVLSIPLGALAGVAAGLVVGIPALRLRGMYLALVTLAFPIIFTACLLAFPDTTGGELGLYGLERLSGSKVLSFYIIFAVFLVSVFIMYKFTDSSSRYLRFGIVLQAIREDEIAARLAGIHTVRYKLIAFAVSGFFAGVAGGLYAHYIRVAGPSTMEMLFSFQVILWTIFGGMGTIYGSVLGTFLLFTLMEVLGLFEVTASIRYYILPIVLIMTLIFMPQGIAVWVLDKIEIRCLRCKLVNAVTRKRCRACRADLRPELAQTVKN